MIPLTTEHDGVGELDRRAGDIASRLLDRTLPKPEWTHEAHVLACIAIVRDRGAAEALAMLRTAIPRYNESTGVANTPTSGYHDTITVYYVWAVDRLLRAGLDAATILADPTIEREGPLQWWDRDELMSERARRSWLAPTRVPAGWDPAERGPHQFDVPAS